MIMETLIRVKNHLFLRFICLLVCLKQMYVLASLFFSIKWFHYDH